VWYTDKKNACRYVVWKDKKAFTVEYEANFTTALPGGCQDGPGHDFAGQWENKYSYA